MMKRRFVPKEVLEKAYRSDIQTGDLPLEDEKIEDKVDRLPEELFQVIGKVVSFIEVSDKMEEK